jgi:hypothetical protein
MYQNQFDMEIAANEIRRRWQDDAEHERRLKLLPKSPSSDPGFHSRVAAFARGAWRRLGEATIANGHRRVRPSA